MFTAAAVQREWRYAQKVKPLRQALPGSGRLPEELRATLIAEGLVPLDEELTGWRVAAGSLCEV
jgi:hypothetical protein